MELEGVLNALSRPFTHFGNLGRFASRKISSLLVAPEVSVMHPELEDLAKRIGAAIGKLGANAERLLRTYQREIVDRQYQLGRVGDAATELYVCLCVLNRLDHMLLRSHDATPELEDEKTVSRFYIHTALRRVRGWLRDLWDNDDQATTEIADRVVRRYLASSNGAGLSQAPQPTLTWDPRLARSKQARYRSPRTVQQPV